MFFPQIYRQGAFDANVRDQINAQFAQSFPSDPPQLQATSGAINPSVTASYLITDAGVAALTLAAPTINGTLIWIASTTAEAHTLTATGLLQTGTASVNEAAFAAHPGAGLLLYGYNGFWIVIASVGITFS